MIGRGEQVHLDIGTLAQFLEEFIADLLRAAAQQLGMMQTDEQYPGRHGLC